MRVQHVHTQPFHYFARPQSHNWFKVDLTIVWVKEMQECHGLFPYMTAENALLECRRRRTEYNRERNRAKRKLLLLGAVRSPWTGGVVELPMEYFTGLFGVGEDYVRELYRVAYSGEVAERLGEARVDAPESAWLEEAANIFDASQSSPVGPTRPPPVNKTNK
jgi:hypothetical protein